MPPSTDLGGLAMIAGVAGKRPRGRLCGAVHELRINMR